MNVASQGRLLPLACGQKHWFPLESAWLPYPIEYEMTAVSKLFNLPTPSVIHRVHQEELVIQAMSDRWRRRLTEQLGTIV